MNVLDNLFDKALSKYDRKKRRGLKRQINGSVRHNRSVRRCSVCNEVTPTYRLIKPQNRAQMCLTCREAELNPPQEEWVLEL